LARSHNMASLNLFRLKPSRVKPARDRLTYWVLEAMPASNPQYREDGSDKPWVVATPAAATAEEAIVDEWKVPIWQRPIDPASLALHPDGPLVNQKRDGYMQKRAGTSRFRWNIRYFELDDGKIKWWRPQFKEMLRLPVRPKVATMNPRPKPVRCLDLMKLKSVTRQKVKFPYSTRILLVFDEEYTKYKLELRAERENIILEWFRVFARFAMEVNETTVETAAGEPTAGETANPGRESDGEESGFEDVASPVAPAAGSSGSGPGGYPASAPAPVAPSGGYAGGGAGS